MEYWVWDNSLKVDIEAIDQQHRRILLYINELSEAIELHDQETAAKVLNAVVEYTVVHFAFEEELMEKSGYPLLEDHRRIHKAFAERVQEYVKKYERGQNISRRLLSDLKLWLTHHIKEDDKDYVPHVKKYLKKQNSWLRRTLRRFFGDHDH